MLRVMARECRFYRRFLSENLNEVVLGDKVRSRILQSMSGVTYVLLAADRKQDRERRIAELASRCEPVSLEGATVVGIASERGDDRKPGLSFDLFMMHQTELGPADIAEAECLSSELGYFRSPQTSARDVWEYPAPAVVAIG